MHSLILYMYLRSSIYLCHYSSNEQCINKIYVYCICVYTFTHTIICIIVTVAIVVVIACTTNNQLQIKHLVLVSVLSFPHTVSATESIGITQKFAYVKNDFSSTSTQKPISDQYGVCLWYTVPVYVYVLSQCGKGEDYGCNSTVFSSILFMQSNTATWCGACFVT